MTEPAALGHITFWGEQASEDIAEKIEFLNDSLKN